MSSGNRRPGTSTIGQPPRNDETAAASSVADMTTIRRSSRASQACFASAMRDIGIHAALVKLVDHDGSESREQRVALQARAQHAFGRDQEAGVAGEAALEPDLPSDLEADRPAALVRNPARDGSRRHPPRLQKDERPVVNKRRRNARGLPCARLRRDDKGARPPQIGNDLGNEGVDRKGVSHSQQSSINDGWCLSLPGSLSSHEGTKARNGPGGYFVFAGA